MRSRLKIELVVGIVLLTLGLYFGNRHGKVNEKLAANAVITKKHDEATVKSAEKVAEAEKKADKQVVRRQSVRNNVKVVYDTIYVPNEAPVVSPGIANLIQQDDSTIVALRVAGFAKDSLIADLRQNVKDRDDRIGLLRVGHVSRGLQVGIGGCYGGHGVQPCAYVGYGVSFR